MHDGETKPGASCEVAVEGLKKPFDLVGGDAYPGVLDEDGRSGAGVAARGKAQRAPVRHRFQAVGGQVPEDLLDLVLVGFDDDLLVGRVDLETCLG